MNKIAVLFFLLICAACGSPYADHKEIGADIHLRYVTLGEGEVVPSDSDSVLIRFRSAVHGEEAGSLMSTEQWYLTKDLRSGALVPILRRLHMGDSMNVIAPGRLWPWQAMTRGSLQAPSDTSTISTALSLLSIRTPDQMRASLAALRKSDPVSYERRLISAFLGSDTSAWMRWGTSDMRYAIEGSAVDTNRVRFGDIAHVQWEGRRLEDQVLFDEVGKVGFPWRVGEQDQLIPGLEAAATLLREGQQGTFILPSALAFGTRGIPGALEPGTVVLYKVRLVRVERGA
jgi:FKBP-type peptidyl-prolyl cis-trans isomerase